MKKEEEIYEDKSQEICVFKLQSVSEEYFCIMVGLQL